MVKFCAALVSLPPLAVPPASWAVTLIVAVPDWYGASVYVSLPLVSTVGATLKRLPPLVTVTWYACSASPAVLLPGPGVYVAQFGTLTCAGAPVTFSFVTVLLALKLGAWLMKLTVMVASTGALVSWPPLAVPPASWAVTLIVAVPDWYGASVYVSLPVLSTAGATLNR